MEDNIDDIFDVVDNECTYYCSDFQCDYTDKLSALHVNSRSLLKNFDKFYAFLSSIKYNFTLIGISETWFKPSTNTAMFNIPGYSFFQIYRSKKRGGGVALYIREGIDYKLRTDLSEANMNSESLFIDINVGNSRYVIGCVYRAPGNDVRSFLDDFDHKMEILIQEKRGMYIMGDFNINLLNIDKDDKVKDFVDLMNSYGLFSLINKPTRRDSDHGARNGDSATLIDNIFTNCKRPFQFWNILFEFF